MKKKSLYLLLIIFSALPALATAQDIDSLLAVLKARQKENIFAFLNGNQHYHVIYGQTTYQNRTYFTGRDIGVDQYNLTLQAAYNYRGFSAAVAGIIYSEFEPHWNLSMLSLAYGHQLLRSVPLDISLSYDRYFYHDPTDTMSAAYPNALMLNFSYSAPRWGLALNPGIFFGTAFTSQQSVSAWLDQEIWRKDDLHLKIRPSLSLILGSGISAYIQMPGDQPPLIETSYGLLNAAISLPLKIRYRDLDMAIAYNLNLPNAPGSDTKYAPTSFLQISLGYIIVIPG